VSYNGGDDKLTNQQQQERQKYTNKKEIVSLSSFQVDEESRTNVQELPQYINPFFYKRARDSRKIKSFQITRIYLLLFIRMLFLL